MEGKAIALSLNFFDWQRLEREASSSAITNALKAREIELSLALTVEDWQRIANNTSVPNVRFTLANEGIEAQTDGWIHVDSSCIDAIAYSRSESTLLIRFNRGDIYRYFQVM